MARLIKRKKSSRYHGRGMGTSGTGARKNKRGSGNKGGKGMSGTGKRADHKKTLVQKLHGHKYFGKTGITRGNNKKDIRKRINLYDIEFNLSKYAKKKGDAYDVVLKNYKILSTGDVKNKLNIVCFAASQKAIEKVEAAGGTITIKEEKSIKTPFVEAPKHVARKENK